MSVHSLNVVRFLVAIAGLVAGPAIALAVSVTWEAQGAVESSNLAPGFFASFIPELAGTQAGDGLVLRISFDTDAASIDQRSLPDGGTMFSFDASLLVLELEVPGRGTHVFAVDDSIPAGATPSFLQVVDDQVIDESLLLDGLRFQQNYFAESGTLLFNVLVAFFSADTSIVTSGVLPLEPDPRFSAGIDRLITIVDFDSGGSERLVGIFSSLVRLPRAIPEPGSLALLCAELAGLWAARRGRADRAG
jgi:hypothetical protein